MKGIFTGFLLLSVAVSFGQIATPSYPHLKYDAGENNWLNLYQAVSPAPTPVVIWAHANGRSPSANDFPDDVWQQLKAAGISLISWESVPQIVSANDVTTCEKDFLNILQWVKENASKYNLDTSNVIISGRSRGSIVSFAGINKSPMGIKGAYFVQALPNGGWKLKDFREDISVYSPNMVLAYADSPETTDGHTPKNGMKIKERYDSLGIGNKIKVYDTLGMDSLYKYLVDFIKKNIK